MRKAVKRKRTPAECYKSLLISRISSLDIRATDVYATDTQFLSVLFCLEMIESRFVLHRSHFYEKVFGYRFQDSPTRVQS